MYKLLIIFLTFGLLFSGCNLDSEKRNNTPVDTEAPVQPKVALGARNVFTYGAKLNITGEAGAAVIVNDQIVGEIDKDGKATVTIPLSGADGVKEIKVAIEDAYGNRSEPFTLEVYKDTTPPQLQLLGDTRMTLEVGENFVEPGYSVKDNIDSSVKVTVAGDVNSATAGVYRILYTAVDSAGNRVVKARVVTVKRAKVINQAPKYNNTLKDINTEDSKSINLDIQNSFSDPDGDTLSFTVTGLPSTLTLHNGVISGTLANDASAHSPYTIKVTARDTGGASATGSFTLTVSNPVPVAKDDTFATDDTKAIDADVIANDSDDDTIKLLDLLFTAGAGSCANESAKIVDNKIHYIPSVGCAGQRSIGYRIIDAQGTKSNTATLLINVTHQNQAPTYNNTLKDINTEDSKSINLDIQNSFSDPDGDTLSFTVTGLPSTLTLHNGVISGTLANDASAHSPYTIKVTARDTGGASATGSFTLTVSNPVPVYTSGLDDLSLLEEDTVEQNITSGFSDPDGDKLSYSANNLPSGLHLSSSGELSGKVAAGASENSPYSVTVTATDAQGASVEREFTISVTAKALHAVDDTIKTYTRRPISFYPYKNDTDADNIDTSSITIESNPENGTLVLDGNGTITYRPNKDFDGVDSFNYNICTKSATKLCDSATVTVKVMKAVDDSNYIKTNWGFQGFTVPSNTIKVSPGDSIQNAIDSLKSLGGGTITLNAGLYSVKKLKLASNIVIEGSGIGKTILKTHGYGDIMEARDSMENIIVRNMTADCSGNGDYNCLEFNYGTHNVLVENIDVFGAGRNNIIAWNEDWSTAGHFTIKNIISHDTVDYHGIALRFVKGAIVAKNSIYKVHGDGIDMSRVVYGEMVNNSITDTAYGLKLPGCDYQYIHDNLIDEVWVEGGIKFNPIDENYNNEHIDIENNMLTHTRGGIIDWGDSAPAPHFAEFVSRNNSVSSDYNGMNMVRVANGTALYDYGNDVRDRDGGPIVQGDEFTHVYRRTKEQDPYDTDGVGYKSWGSP